MATLIASAFRIREHNFTAGTSSTAYSKIEAYMPAAEFEAF
jgi:hypothetical protein